nr:cell division protein ZapA [Lachnospiraceae bacterium]
VIGGKVIKLVGYESEEYLQKLAGYINGKLSEYEKIDSFKRQPIEMQNVLIQLNMADDYFKVKNKLDEITEEMELKDKELYDIKHELIATQIKMESKDKMIRDYQKELTKV